MHILVINGSPKGKNSTTLHTALYLQALHKEHSFEILHAGQQIRKLEQDFSPAVEAIARADLLLFSYPVYTFLVPYQLHRFLELLFAHHVDLSGKFASQISTSKHFYDSTAQRFLEENCLDLGLKTVRGLAADMDDLLKASGKKDAEQFFDQLMFACEKGLFLPPLPKAPEQKKEPYHPTLPEAEKKLHKRAVIVTSCAEGDENLRQMIADFRRALPMESRVLNLHDIPFAGGCIGCFSCAVTGACIYRDGFDRFLREEIQSADAICYAFTIEHHYADALFKCYDDRQFCNGHRTVTRGIPAAYLLSGAYAFEPNLRNVIESRCEVGGTFLAGVATDEQNTAEALQKTAESLARAVEENWRRPADFRGVGGMKIFRDLIYVMRGLMKADHKFYRKNGIYDFPQKQWGRIFQMQMVGAMMAIPSVQKKMRGKMNDYIIAPYEKVVAEAEKKTAHQVSS